MPMNKAHNENRIRFESEKIEIFKQDKLEVKSWRRDLGQMTRKHKNLEKKLSSLESNSFDIEKLRLIDSNSDCEDIQIQVLKDDK